MARSRHGSANDEATKACGLTLLTTFDTGVLIALERRTMKARELVSFSLRFGIMPVVPTVAIAEWWRGRSDARETILESLEVEKLTLDISRVAGQALGAVKGATLVDAIVMASAALRGGGVVYTSDVADLTRLQSYFTTVNVLPI